MSLEEAQVSIICSSGDNIPNMIKIVIPGTSVAVSRFIFGTASLFSVGSKKDRDRLLRAAVDNGFTHFDTAPYYGFGMAERDLAPILSSNPHVTVTTKVGLYSPGGETQSSATIFLRKALGRAFPPLSRPTIDFTVSRAQKSLEGSLRRLRRDNVELFMLHEPAFELLDSDEWLKWLGTRVASGQVVRFGLALQAKHLDLFLAQGGDLADVIQTTDSIDHKEADVLLRYNRVLQITYGYVSAARSHSRNSSVVNILHHALQRNRNGAIIVSTKRVERLGQYSRILEEMR